MLFSQSIQAGLGWGLFSFQNNVVEKKGFNTLSYKVDGDFFYAFILKYRIPEKNLRFKGEYYFAEIQGAGRIDDIEPTENSRPLFVRTENSLVSFALGLEYVVDGESFSPYFGLDLLMGIFDDAQISYVDQKRGQITKIFPSKTRMGLGINVGINYELLQGINLDLNFQYSSLNLLGKEDYEDNILTTDISLLFLFIL